MRWMESFIKEGLVLNTFTDKNSGKPFQVVTQVPFLGVILTNYYNFFKCDWCMNCILQRSNWTIDCNQTTLIGQLLIFNFLWIFCIFLISL